MLSILIARENARIAWCIWSNTLLNYVSSKSRFVVIVSWLLLLVASVSFLPNPCTGKRSCGWLLFRFYRIGALH